MSEGRRKLCWGCMRVGEHFVGDVWGKEKTLLGMSEGIRTLCWGCLGEGEYFVGDV
jgi:hypothetical protein